MELGTFILVVGSEDYEKAINFAKRGLMSNPGNFLLRNNLSVALAEFGKVDEAKGVYQTIRPSILNVWEETCWLATKGLIAFRERCYDEGRMLYDRAVTLGETQSDRELEAMVLVHWAREELRAGEYQRAGEIAERAVQASKGLSGASVKMALLRFHNLRDGDKDEEPAYRAKENSRII